MERQERERRYISEYMLATYPGGGYQLNVPLGAIPEKLVKSQGLAMAIAMYRPTRPRVDAVKWTDSEYWLIEAKVREIKQGIGDLVFYRGHALESPDLPHYEGQQIRCRLVVPWSIDWINASARQNDIELVVFTQPWIEDYVKARQHYHTAEYREERAEKMRLRRALGVE